MLRAIPILCSLSLSLTAFSNCSVAEAIEIGVGPHLFIDDHLIASQTGLKRVICAPQRHADPIVTGVGDRNFQPYVSVVQDPQTKRFRMWYQVPAVERKNFPSRLAYMESADGVHWNRPHQVLENPGGMEIRFGASVIDDGPSSSDPAERFKYAWYWGPITDPPSAGLMVAVSPDGLNWTPLSTKPPLLIHSHDINNIYHDRLRNRYLATVSIFQQFKEGENALRMPFHSESTDLVHWSEPWQVLSHDEQDEGKLQFYAMNAYITRGPLLIGIAKILRQDLPAEPDGEVQGIGYSVLAWTRDGKHWERDREPFLDRNPSGGTWDRAISWIDCQVPVGDEVYLYYGGYKSGHKAERFVERQIGLARMRRDRYVARTAQREGSLKTRLVIVRGATLTVNADVEGELRVRALDREGSPISGFDFDDAPAVQGDDLAHVIQWKRPLTVLNGAAVHLEFRMRHGSLYAFALGEATKSRSARP